VRGVVLGDGEVEGEGDGEVAVGDGEVVVAGVEGDGVEAAGVVDAGVVEVGMMVVGEAVVPQPASRDRTTNNTSDKPKRESRLLMHLDNISTPLYFPPEALFH
jgi:hypothetical protein